ncbi:MAG: hypothetical protein QGH60_18175 [Phycisphaerae bacterium]|jgi:hypothetical protein|nr:hypothetical protein [Phycisphaerae bacterium]
MLGIWSIAKHTFTQCVRMKLAAAFIVLLAVVLLALPGRMTGDGTLAGQIRTFLEYGTGISLGLLSIMTIFVGAALVSDDIRTKQIFTVAVKPIARWQYLLGRWVGLVLFDAVLLVLACVAIYATAHYLRTKQYMRIEDKGTTRLRRVSMPDRRAVETEIFTARRQITPDPLDLQLTVSRRIKQMRDAGSYEQAVDKWLAEAEGNRDLAAGLLKRDIEREIIAEKTEPLALDTALAHRVKELKDARQYRTAVEGWMPQAEGNKDEAERMLLDQLRREIGGKLQSIAPNGTMWWSFSNVNVTGREVTRKAHVVTPLGATGRMEFRTTEFFACRLWQNGPVKINGFDAGVVATDGRTVVASLLKSSGGRQRISNLVAGDTVELTVEPIMQISYKLTPTDHSALPDGKFKGKWQATDRSRPGLQWPDLPDVTDQKVTLTMSAGLVGENGKVQFAINNLSPTSAKVLFRDVALLYDVDSFENNFIRASLLMLCQLAYLAGVSIFAGSFVSFPVACLTCFVLVPFSLARKFLVEASNISIGGDVDTMMWIAHYVFKPLNVLLPDFARTMPGDRLVDGMDISWAFVGDTAVADVVIRAGVALLLACLIFHRRELARVQI